MLHRRMGRRNTVEMSAVMLLAAVPFLCLVWFDVTETAQCGGYCLLTILAMLGLMRYRHDEYAVHHHEEMNVDTTDAGRRRAIGVR